MSFNLDCLLCSDVFGFIFPWEIEDSSIFAYFSTFFFHHPGWTLLVSEYIKHYRVSSYTKPGYLSVFIKLQVTSENNSSIKEC